MRLLVCAIVAFALLVPSAAHLCGSAIDISTTDPGMRPLGKGALACTEFWFNRYQTLIGACAALAAGYAAYRAAIKQVSRADAQISLMTKQTAIDRVEYINSRLEPIDQLYENALRAQNWSRSALERANSLHMTACEIANAAGGGSGEHIRIFSDAFQPMLRSIIDEGQAVARAVDALITVERDASLPENVRQGTGELIYQFATINNKISDFIRRAKPNISIMSPGVDAVHSEFKRLAQNIAEIPEPVNCADIEVFKHISENRRRLFALRRVAEEIAET